MLLQATQKLIRHLHIFIFFKQYALSEVHIGKCYTHKYQTKHIFKSFCWYTVCIKHACQVYCTNMDADEM
jgi:hypothetical protein